MSQAKNREIRISIPEDIFSFFFPDQSVDHILKARKEMLLALRSLIDARIDTLEKKGEKKTAQRKKIKIE